MIPIRRARTGVKRVLFYAESPVKYAMFRPVHERLRADDRVEVTFSGKLRGAGSSRAMARALGVEGARAVRRGIATLTRFDLMVTADYEIWKPFENPRLPIHRTPRLQLFHGVSVRNGAIQPKMTRFQHLFSVGPYMDRAFAAAGVFAAGDPRLRPVGMPKTDRLLDGSLDRARVRAALGVNDDRPVVTLAPTWIPRTPMNRYGEALLDALAAGPWNLLVKLHDKFFDPRYNTVDWRRRLAAFAKGRPGVRVIADYDAIETLYATDVLISDVSSIANEFALLDRPLVYLAVEDPERLQKQYPRLDLDTWGQRPGAVVDGARACVDAVAQALAEPERGGEIRRAMVRDLFHHPGAATRPAVQATYELLELDPPPDT